MQLTTPRSPTGNVWYQHIADLPDGGWSGRAIMTDLFPDGTAVETDDIGADRLASIGDDTVVWTADQDDQGRCRVHATDLLCPGAPDAWFVLISEADDPSLGADLVGIIAFCTDDLDDGTVVSASTARELGVSARDRAATLTWVRDSGLVTNIRTEPDHRRGQLGVKLLVTTGGIIRYRGWGGKIHSDGLRSEEGQRLAESIPMPGRIAKWTAHARVGLKSDNPPT